MTGDDYVSASTYSQKRMLIKIEAKPTAWLLLRTVTQKITAQNRCSWVSFDRPLPKRPSKQAIWPGLTMDEGSNG